MFKELSMHNSILIKRIAIVLASIVAILLIGLLYFFLFTVRAPSNTQYPVRVTIESGQSTQSIARELAELGIVRNPKFTLNLLVSGGEKKIQAGTYIFQNKLSVFNVAKKVLSSDYGYVPIKITIPEGTSSKRLAVLVNSKLPNIDKSEFEVLARSKEGYLFPETYFFPPEASAEEVIARMEVIFKRKISTVQDDIEKSGKTLNEILTIASILEGEVKTSEDRAMVADLLERRTKIGMPLQVDTTLVYITGKTSATLTSAELKSDGPYNTYTRKGLPPTPISNPGLNSIKAALNPIPNEYFFYLSDKDGITHFSKTHDEHVRLKNKYLR